MNDKAQTFAEEVWYTLSNVDVTDHVEELPKSGNRPPIKYLPWHKAWMLLKRNFPASIYFHKDDLVQATECMEVEVVVHIINSENLEEYIQASARLAVMDHRFNAVLCPDSRKINDARQRCLVKALAFAGLGLNLWSESALPVGKLDAPINSKQVKIINDLLKKTQLDIDSFLEWLGVDAVEFIPHESYAKAKAMLKTKLQS